MRAQATARLAKEEKDFRSTVVLSENDMFVLPNINGLGKRNKKKPKRFNECLLMDGTMDFVDLCEDASADKGKLTVASEVDRMRHARVTVPKMTVLNSLEPLCMVHQIYRCFCGNTATRGRPFELILDKRSDSSATPTEESDAQALSNSQWETAATRKRQYTFERDANAIVKKAKTPAEIVHDLTNSAIRTRPYSGRKFVSKADIRQLRARLKELEAPFMNKLLLLQAPGRKFAVPKRPMPEFVEIPDDDDDDDNSTDNNRDGSDEDNRQRLTSSNNNRNVARDSNAGADGRQPRALTDMSNPVDVMNIQKLNQTVTLMMQKIFREQSCSSLCLTQASMGILDCRSWVAVLRAYQNRRIFIWLVRFGDDNEAILALTVADEMPMVRGATSISTIETNDVNTLPLVGRLLREGVLNDTTKQLGMCLCIFLFFSHRFICQRSSTHAFSCECVLSALLLFLVISAELSTL